MLGRRIVVDGEEQVIAGFEGIEGQRDHVTAGGIGERFLVQRLGPIAQIGWRVFGIGAIDRPPDAAHKAHAIAAGAFERRLMTIGRANPRTASAMMLSRTGALVSSGIQSIPAILAILAFQ